MLQLHGYGASSAFSVVAAVAGQPVTDGLMHETARRLSEQRASPDAQEGIGAFLGRRKPAWTEGA